MEAKRNRLLVAMVVISGVALFLAGLVCLVISSLIVETNDGFFISLESWRVALPDSGMLGDESTYRTEWGILGLLCLGAVGLIVLISIAQERLARWGLGAALVVTLAMAAMFVRNLVF